MKLVLSEQRRIVLAEIFKEYCLEVEKDPVKFK